MIDVLIDEDVDEHPLPSPASIRQAALAALTSADFKIEAKEMPELCIRFVADADIQALNRLWRNKDEVTDVLSFPLQEGPDFDISQGLGDIALAVPFILAEARRLGLSAHNHCLHLIVHACLHLVGFDHIRDEDAAVMQALERQAMLNLGLHDPYPNSEEETI